MDDYKKCMIIDKTIILCGVLGVITSAVALLLGLQGNIAFDINYLLLLPVAVFFIFYGIKMLKRDKEKYGDK